jgi:hypothetical protein
MHDLIQDTTMTITGIDSAIIGTVETDAGEVLLAYCYEKCIEHFVSADGMSHEESMEWVDYNVVGSYMGSETPVILFEDDEGLCLTQAGNEIRGEFTENHNVMREYLDAQMEE